MEAVKNFVDETIKSKPVVVFSKSYCPFCVKVKNLIKDELKVSEDKYTFVELESRSDCSDVQTYLKELTGASSVSFILHPTTEKPINTLFSLVVVGVVVKKLLVKNLFSEFTSDLNR